MYLKTNMKRELSITGKKGRGLYFRFIVINIIVVIII